MTWQALFFLSSLVKSIGGGVLCILVCIMLWLEGWLEFLLHFESWHRLVAFQSSLYVAQKYVQSVNSFPVLN